jgi:hypothetical protein
VTYCFQGCSVSHNLAVCGYKPTENQTTAGISASELLIAWTKMILLEFSIDAEADILTSCTDSSSDVKKALEKVLPTLWEWCISHLSHLALTDAFGSSLDPAKSRNVEVRDLLNQCRKVMEKINKSKQLKATFDGLVLNDVGRALKMKNSPAHMSSATEGVLERLLWLWSHVQNAFNETNAVFPIATD